MVELASSFKDQDRWKEAEAQEVWVMKTRKRLYGEEHPDTLVSMANLASTYRKRGRREKAESTGVRANEDDERMKEAIHLLQHVIEAGEKSIYDPGVTRQSHDDNSPLKDVAVEFDKAQAAYPSDVEKPGTMILDDPSRVAKIRDRGESFRLRKLQEQHRNSRPPATDVGVRYRNDSKGDNGLINKIAIELDEAMTACPLEPDKLFVPNPEFAKIITFDRVRRIVFSLECLRKEKNKEELAREIYYGRSDGSGHAVKLLAVLIGINKAEDFLKHLSDGMRDSCLPLRKITANKYRHLECQWHRSHATLNGYSRPRARDNFATWSYALNAPFIKWEPRYHSHYILDTGDVIPMEIVDKVKHEDSPTAAAKNASHDSDNMYGGFSEVYKVKLHNGHWDFGDHGIRHPQGFFALKKLTSHKSIDFNLELSSLLFTYKLYDKKHVIQLLATFEVVNFATGVSTFFLLFDWAEGSLDKFWQNNQNLVGNKTHCFWMASQFYEICAALQCVHNDRVAIRQYLEDDRDSDEALYGRHGDIKPGNLLWFHSNTTPGPGLLALSDFGLGELHTQTSRSKQDPRNIERTATYRSPEFDLPLGQISPRSDIFSLGCVLLEYITWFCLGLDAVENTFPDRRMETDIYGIESDVFFSINHNQAILKPAVAEWIQGLQNHPDCSWYIFELLETIRDRMLEPDSSKRISSSQLAKRMKDFLKSCEADSDYYMRRHSLGSNEGQA
ncbi:protein kinase domain-containing protein [Colletotrichum plurivorum]|uniref:Protein kinase domain-containing protein n=1 Tax=Colletotrichum plurivorum TaxID=2175906 RepID=A0A8H6K476_9PEZI|nr:protein kinase domain-containing protein [Colletotrichum plurivorum]